MSANITQMPTMQEYIRAYPVFDGDKLAEISLFPMLPFRVATFEFGELLHATFDSVDKIVDPDEYQCASQLLNHKLNVGIIQLELDGKVFAGQKMHGNISGLNALYDRSCFVITADGYTVFNPVYMPPTPSKETH